MYGLSGHSVIDASIATGATSSSALFVGGYNHVAIEIPTFSVGVATATANVYVQVAQTSTGTFRRVKDMGVYSASSGIGDWEVPSSIGNYMVVCDPAAKFNYMKVELSNVATAVVSCRVHVHN
jgi:hypothetical protein